MNKNHGQKKILNINAIYCISIKIYPNLIFHFNEKPENTLIIKKIIKISRNTFTMKKILIRYNNNLINILFE